MRCPVCKHRDTRVIDSRLGRDDTEIRRRRECLECARRFTTRERVEDVLPKLVKRDERREDFDRRKLLASIEKRMQEAGQTELASAAVGAWVLEELIQIDIMAAARFASVFRGFESAEDYVEFFASARAGLYAAGAPGFDRAGGARAPEAPRRPLA